MPINTDDARARQKRIAAPAAPLAATRRSPGEPSAPGDWSPAVVRWVEPRQKEMWFQFIRYVEVPPGNDLAVELASPHGKWHRGYPHEMLGYEEYVYFVHEFLSAPHPGINAILYARRDPRGFWVLVPKRAEFVVVEIFETYLKCHADDGNTFTDPYYVDVSLPADLYNKGTPVRSGPYIYDRSGNVSLGRRTSTSASDPNDVEIQEITPPLSAGDKIEAVFHPHAALGRYWQLDPRRTWAAVPSATAAAASEPLAHAGTHVDGTDDIRDATSEQKGLATPTQVAKLGAIEEGAPNVWQYYTYIESPTATDDLPLGPVFSRAATLKKVWAETDVGTFTFTLARRNIGSVFTPTGQTTMEAGIVASASCATETSFTEASIEADDQLAIDATAIASSPTKVKITAQGTFD